MASWREHFAVWHKIVKTDLTPVAEDGWVKAGREAEDLLRQLVNENFSFRGCYSFAAKRIPDPQNQRRREIDLIVVTAKKMYVIECKNWSGTLKIDGDRWVQTSGGKVKHHDDVLLLNTLKMRLLIAYLQREGIRVQPDRICQKVIFMNKKLDIQSLVIEKNFDVITPERLDEYLSAQNNQLKFHEKLLSSVIGLLLDEELKGVVLDGLAIERVGGENHERLIQVIGQLPTWDKIFLHGTKILSGDIIKSSANIYADPRQLPFDRIKEIRVKLVKSKWWGFIKALLRVGRPIGLDLYDDRGKLLAATTGNPHGLMRIMEAGSPQPNDVGICQIDRVVYGRKRLAAGTSSVDRRKLPKPLVIAIVGGILLAIPGVRDFLTNPTSIGRWWKSESSPSPTETLDSYTGKYDFGRYAVKIYRQGQQLFAETAVGKAELRRSNNKNEFVVFSPSKGRLGKYIFTKNKQGQIQYLVWVQNNGRTRKCPKIAS
jgi:hypothetical protein